MNFLITIVITFILALIFMIIIAFVVKFTGQLVFGNGVFDDHYAVGAALIASAIIAGAAVVGGKSDVTIVN